MKRWLRPLFIVLLCTALFTGYGAKAQDIFKPEKGAIPVKIKGSWALPDCRVYDEAMIITRHFYLRSNREGSTFWPIDVQGKRMDYMVLTIEGEGRPVRLEEDGVLKIGVLSKRLKQWPKTWEGLGLERKREYMGCAEIPAILPDPLVRVMIHIDAIEAACHSGLSEGCTHLFFDIADVDKNKKLSLNEFKMAGVMLAGFAALAENHSVSRRSLDKTLYESLREGDRVADVLMPGGQELAYEGFAGFLPKTNSAVLHAALASAGTLFPAFKQAVALMAKPQGVSSDPARP